MPSRKECVYRTLGRDPESINTHSSFGLILPKSYCVSGIYSRKKYESHLPDTDRSGLLVHVKEKSSSINGLLLRTLHLFLHGLYKKDSISHH